MAVRMSAATKRLIFMLEYREFVCGCDAGAVALAVSCMAVRAPRPSCVAVAGQVSVL